MVLRRDFLNGFALGTVGALAPRWALGLDDAAPEKAPGYYPPALTGLRGSYEGSYQAAHALRDGKSKSEIVAVAEREAAATKDRRAIRGRQLERIDA